MTEKDLIIQDLRRENAELREKLAKDTNVHTNADLIRSMSDQGLALCLYEIGYVGGWYSKKDVLEWLQQPAEEDENG